MVFESLKNLLTVKIAKPLHGLIVLAVKMPTVHCYLLVLGQESGYW